MPSLSVSAPRAMKHQLAARCGRIDRFVVAVGSDPLGHQFDRVHSDAPPGRTARPPARRQIGAHRARTRGRGVAPCQRCHEGSQRRLAVPRLVAALENRTMRTELIDRSHPFLIGRIIRVVGDLRNFTQSPPCRLQALLARVIAFLTKLAIRAQTRWRQRIKSQFGGFRFYHCQDPRLASAIEEITPSSCSTRNDWALSISSATQRGRTCDT